MHAVSVPAGTNGYLDSYLPRSGTRAPLTKTPIIADNSNPDWPGTHRFWVDSGEQVRLDAEVHNDRGPQQCATLPGTATVAQETTSAAITLGIDHPRNDLGIGP